MQPRKEITQEYLDLLDEDHRSLQFVPVKSLQLVNLSHLSLQTEETTASREFSLGQDARHWLSRYSGVPLVVTNAIDDKELETTIWNHFLRKKNESGDLGLLKAVVKNDHITAFTMKSAPEISPSEVVRAVQGAIIDAEFEREPCLTNRSFEFIMTGSQLFEDFQSSLKDVMTSDVHHFGISYKHSLYGDEMPEMNVYGHRHHCGNIMTAAYGVNGKQMRIFTTDKPEMLGKIMDFSRKGVEFIKMTMIPHILSTIETQLLDPANDLNDMLNKALLPERVQELVFEAYRTEDLGGTAYHAINAITRAANSDRCPDQYRPILRALGGMETATHNPAGPKHRCDSCHQQIKKDKTRRTTR